MQSMVLVSIQTRQEPWWWTSRSARNRTKTAIPQQNVEVWTNRRNKPSFLSRNPQQCKCWKSSKTLLGYSSLTFTASSPNAKAASFSTSCSQAIGPSPSCTTGAWSWGTSASTAPSSTMVSTCSSAQQPACFSQAYVKNFNQMSKSQTVSLVGTQNNLRCHITEQKHQQLTGRQHTIVNKKMHKRHLTMFGKLCKSMCSTACSNTISFSPG